MFFAKNKNGRHRLNHSHNRSWSYALVHDDDDDDDDASYVMACASLTTATGLGMRLRLVGRPTTANTNTRSSPNPQPHHRTFVYSRDGAAGGAVRAPTARGIFRAAPRHTATTTIVARVSTAASSSSASFPDDEPEPLSSSADVDAAEQQKDAAKKSSRSSGEEGLVGYPDGRGRLSLILDGCSRMALPSETCEEMQKRPTSDILWGFSMCFITFALLSVAESYFKASAGHPFMVGSFGTVAVLSFGSLAREVEWSNPLFLVCFCFFTPPA